MGDATEPRVSVVVPTNRTGRFLDAALASVDAQSYPRWELIVAANSTADLHALQRIVDRHPKARLVYQPTTGPVLSRNLGTALAKGEYVAFLDDDDIWHPERLATQVAQLDAHSEAIACYSAAWTIDGTGATISTSWLPTGVPADDLLRGRVDIPRIITMLFRRRELIRIGGFHPSFRFAEDDELILRALRFGELTWVPQPLVGYRRHDHNVTGADVERRQLAGRRVITLQRWGAEAWDDPEWAEVMAENYERYVRRTAEAKAGDALSSLRRGELVSGAATLRDAVRTSPLFTVTGVADRVKAKLWPTPEDHPPTPTPDAAEPVRRTPTAVDGAGRRG
jgi:glycosyltransferase involved in cell wall biosynthesis